MQHQELPAAAGRPAGNVNAMEHQNGDLVARDKPPSYRSVHRNFNLWLRVVLNNAKIDFSNLCHEITALYRNLDEQRNDREAYNRVRERVFIVKAQIRELRSWRARTFNTVNLTHSMSWDSGMNLYKENNDPE